MSEAFLTSAFAAMGENIVNVKIMKNKSTGYVKNHFFQIDALAAAALFVNLGCSILKAFIHLADLFLLLVSAGFSLHSHFHTLSY